MSFLRIGTIGVGGDAGTYVVLALIVLIYFALFWGYFMLFETLWSGQTPGKRAGRLRVIRRDGQPVGAGEVLIRNLVRIVDFLPGFYGIGLVVMFIDKEARRLGDMAAGTIVVREGDTTRLQDVRVQSASCCYPLRHPARLRLCRPMPHIHPTPALPMPEAMHRRPRPRPSMTPSLAFRCATSRPPTTSLFANCWPAGAAAS